MVPFIAVTAPVAEPIVQVNAGVLTRRTTITDCESYYGPAQGQVIRLAQFACGQNRAVLLAEHCLSSVILLGEVESNGDGLRHPGRGETQTMKTSS